jgi:aryl-alcohol dehydrogenase-like predicted oxidoreductase
LLSWAQAERIGTLIRVPLAKGMLTGKYSGPGAAPMPQGDHRHERFNRPDVSASLHKIMQLEFLQTPERTMVQAALRFVLDHPGVSCVISGAKTRQQVRENAHASDVLPLTPDELARALPIADTIATPNWSG